ncbi:MAG: Rsd/AlgQ family anti-sigma factor [Halioglobus sp.]
MPHRDPQQQFNTVEELLTRWLKARRELLGKYTEIAVGMDGLLDRETLDLRQRALCQLLVDYVSAGHFEVYLELFEEAESFADGSSALAEKLMPAIGDTTEVIMAYEEKYTSADSDKVKLKRDLSALGEVLESRFLLEDKLIAGLHNSHRRQQS